MNNAEQIYKKNADKQSQKEYQELLNRLPREKLTCIRHFGPEWQKPENKSLKERLKECSCDVKQYY